MGCPFAGLDPTIKGRLVISLGRAALSGATLVLLLLLSGTHFIQDGRAVPLLPAAAAVAVKGALVVTAGAATAAEAAGAVVLG